MSTILWNSIDFIKEIHTLIPDSILFGSLLMYILTHNLSFGVFAVFVFEMSLSHRLISWMFSQSVGSSRSIDLPCRVGFKTPQFRFERIFSHDPYPSYGVFSITSIATYLGLSISEFSQTLDSMGKDWSKRKLVSTIFISLFILGFSIARWLSGCDSKLEITIAFICAIIVGLLFFRINTLLFGLESVNFLGLPYLVSKASQGSPIYVCMAEDKNA
jgi:hypothetical protein